MSRKKQRGPAVTRIEWLRPDEEHQGLGLLVTGHEYDVPAKLAETWIGQGAAAPRGGDIPADVVLISVRPHHTVAKQADDAPMPGQEE